MQEFDQLTTILSIALLTNLCLLVLSLIKVSRLEKENGKLKKELKS